MRDVARDTVVDGRYQVIDRLGSGGMADVFCAQDLQLGRKVALKLLHERFAEDEEFVERFRREASSAAGLQHQHVVSVYDRGDWEGTAYIAMEYIAGSTLKEVIQREGPLDPARAVDLTIQILRAARFAHRRGVIHRDLKPHNVMLDDEGRVKVTDFGIARAGASDMTQTGSIMGTAQYLSPEQAQGHAVNATSDLYSIGVVLYELLTGQIPFEAESAVSIAVKHVNEPPVPPARLSPAVTPELDAIVLRALAKDPAERFADADEFIAALEAAASRLAGATAATAVGDTGALGMVAAPVPLPVGVPPTGLHPAAQPYEIERERVYAPPERARRRRWPWALLAALLVAGAIVAALLLTGEEAVQVPNVVGSSISVAQQRLEDEGFEVTTVRDNSDKPRNTVVGQNPGPNEVADEGSEVTITVSDGPAIRAVPDVAGEGRRTARRTLRAAGFEVRERRAFSAEVRVNRVIEQSPSGSSQAEQGSTVTITVSRGPEQATVPSVVGRGEDEARRALEDAGFRVAVRQQESEDARPGIVLAQDPAAGGRLTSGSTVTLTVAEESQEVEVPDVVGDTQNEATQTLSAAGFEVDVEETRVDSPGDDGEVRSQSPRGGRRADRDSAVTITVGRFDPDLDPDPEPGQQPEPGPGGGPAPPPASP
ncbi:MAG: Stk1 family PASTA domain-containing Ser/Thr kinase [Solirubrobacterales bacterium]|nr:Stk1 family PASTA domain-containing Ser/Thr kinase [Solirubrobacterales bacterium]